MPPALPRRRRGHVLRAGIVLHPAGPRTGDHGRGGANGCAGRRCRILAAVRLPRPVDEPIELGCACLRGGWSVRGPSWDGCCCSRGLQRVGVAVTTPIYNVQVLFTAVAGVLFFSERLTPFIGVGDGGDAGGPRAAGPLDASGGNRDRPRRALDLLFPLGAGFFIAITYVFRKWGLADYARGVPRAGGDVVDRAPDVDGRGRRQGAGALHPSRPHAPLLFTIGGAMAITAHLCVLGALVARRPVDCGASAKYGTAVRGGAIEALPTAPRASLAGHRSGRGAGGDGRRSGQPLGTADAAGGRSARSALPFSTRYRLVCAQVPFEECQRARPGVVGRFLVVAAAAVAEEAVAGALVDVELHVLARVL